jgi:modulator of FtsH protease
MTHEWDNFFVAMAGASAALAGLIFVGVSLSLSKILAFPNLPNRALNALSLLTIVLIVSILCLIPGQSVTCLGTELLCAGLGAWLFTLRIDLQSIRNTKPKYKRISRIYLAIDHVAIWCYIAGGVLLLVSGPGGMYWLVPGIIVSFLKAIMDAWVLLVEIHR